MIACKFFAKGACTYGTSCKNSHEAEAPPESQSGLLPKETTPNKTTNGQTASKLKQPSIQAGTCWFFTQGTCTFGADCRKSHEVPSNVAFNAVDPEDLTSVAEIPNVHGSLPTRPCTSFVVQNTLQHGTSPLPPPGLRANAPDFTPSVLGNIREPASTVEAGSLSCIFFSKGYCKYGAHCRYRHEGRSRSFPSDSFHERDRETAILSNEIFKLSLTSTISHEFHGATVIFGSGADVSYVKLSSDFSSIQITGLSPDARPSFVLDLLASMGFQIQQHNILLKSLGDEGSVAEVKIEDPAFSKLATRTFESRPDKSINASICIKPINGGASTGTLPNRLQLSTVTCTWYKPSRVAWLRYGSRPDALDAHRFLKSRKVLDRSPECSLQQGARSSVCHLVIANLDSRTQKRDFEALLKGQLRPQQIKLGIPSYPLSDTQASEIIETILRGKGALESFQWHILTGNSKIKATATFSDRDSAAEAVRSLNNTTVTRLGETKIYLGHVISVKYNIPCAIMNAISGEIDQLRESIWQSAHINLKRYPQADPTKPIVVIRVFGEDIKHVAEAKAAIEKLLKGKTVMNGDSALWDTFFLNSKSLTYLNELSRENNVYIYRDARKSQLSIYGGSSATCTEVEGVLVAKIVTLQQSTNRIVLTPDLLKRAMQGGMRRLKEKFGGAVFLDISATPKTISVTGSASDIDEARALLLKDSVSTQEADDCVVCWTDAVDPIHTTCGHVYCKDCFASQAASAGENEIPLRCHGNNDKCLEVFGIHELKQMLSHTAFEDLLEKSFDTHIRTHPKDFQYCPTPDCPQVYRVTATGDKFLCSTCLISVCTSCKVAHDGISCAEYKDLSSEGMKAFQKWKKDNDVRDCPNCKTAIEKNHGCNHMECKQCSTHICWFCMDTFKSSGECYRHMSKVHSDGF